MTTAKQKRIEAAKVSDYELSLTTMLGKKVKDITGHVSQEFGDRTFKLCNLILDDGTTLRFEGEHDHPYLTEGYGDNPGEISDELLAAYDEDEEDDEAEHGE
jgi:hypothetical protein